MVTKFVLPDSLKEDNKQEFVLPNFDTQAPNFLNEDVVDLQKESDPSVAEMGAALATEIAIAETGRQVSAAFGPIGYVLGGLASGAAGSIAAQKITNPEDISEGRVLADAFINLIPGLKAAKGRSMLAEAATRQAPIGAAIGAGGITLETAVDEGRLPTTEEFLAAGLTGGMLGGALGLTGAKVNELMLRHGGSPVEQITKVIREKQDPDLVKMYQNLKNRSKDEFTLAEKFTEQKLLDIRQQYTDANIMQRQLQKEYGQGQGINKDGILELTEYKDPKDNIITRDDQDYYQAKRLAEGRIEGGLERIVKEDDAITNELATIGVRLGGKTAKELSDSVDRYLHAKYAIDYNKISGKGSPGMTTEQAKEIVKKFESSGLDKTLKNPIQLIRNQIDRTNQIAVEGGLISQKTLDQWKKEYGDNYVPLHRILDEDTQFKSESPQAVDGMPPNEVRWSGIYDDVGSELEVRSIKENVYRQLADVTRRAELNKANLAFVKLINAPGNKEAAKGILKEINGKKFGTLGKQDKAPSNSALTYLENGEKKYLEFADAGLAQAFRGTPVKDMGAMTKAIYTFSAGMNRRLGALYTRFNPDFVIPNLFRDRTEAAINNTIRLNASQGLATLNPAKAIKDDMNIIYRKQRGLPAQSTQQKEIYRLYDEFKEDGGSVGGLAGTTQIELIDEVNNLAKNLSASQPKQLANKVVKFFDNANNVFEDSTRFRTYKLAREAGKSRPAAALAARDSSFDPRLGGTNVNVLRATYLFANPALQASKVFLKNLYQKPKMAAGFFGTLMGIKLGLDRWNSSIDPDWEEKLKTTTGSDYVKNKSLVFLTGIKEDGSPSYVSLPIGYSMVPFAVAADYAQKAATGKETTGTYAEQVGDVISELGDAYNPVGRTFVPTPLTPFTDLMMNKDGLERTIRPEWLESKNIAAKEKMFPFTMDTYGGEMAFAMAETAEKLGLEVSPENLKYLFDKFTGGPGRTMSNIINIVSDVKNGREINKREIPIARRFFGDGYKEKFEQRAGIKSEIEEFTRIDNTERARESRIASKLFRQLKDAKENNRFEEASDIMSKAIEDGTLTQSVIKRLERRIKNDRLGLNQTDRRVKQLSVARRGQYLIRQMEKMSVPEIRKFLLDQTRKGIITKNVMEDVGFIKAFEKIQQRLQQ